MMASRAERYWLFTIIVLGEVIVGVVAGVADVATRSWMVGATAALGLVVAIGLWWIYFDFVSNRVPGVESFKVLSWSYLHLPITLGIAAVGAGGLNVVDHTDAPPPQEVRSVLVGALAVGLAAMALTMKLLPALESYRRGYRRVGALVFVAGAAAALVWLLPLGPMALLAALIGVLLVPILFAVLGAPVAERRQPR